MKKSWMPIILATCEAEMGRITVGGQQNGLKVSQMVEHLLYKPKALSSNL
jgi:hypothetical protein